MPRGRHRHSPPLHKPLPPSAVAGAAVLCAVVAWLFADPVVLRLLVAAAAVVGVVGAAFMRVWDRDAGYRVADLKRARESDQWKQEERLAELESEIEEARELRGKLDAKLRAKRVELAGLRGEHAALLRRYATAETERASALEGRRQLALEAAAEPKALPPAGSTPTASAYLRAARALDDLTFSAEAQQIQRTLEAARRTEEAARSAETGAPPAGEAEPASASAPAADPHGGERTPPPAEREQHSRPSTALPAKRVPGASAIVPYSPLRAPAQRPGTGFDFFGTQSSGTHSTGTHSTGTHSTGTQSSGTRSARPGPAKPERGGPRPENKQPVAAGTEGTAGEDLADVVGEETFAAQRRTEERVVGQVIDLTEHDEPEPLDVGHLRSAIGT